MEGAPEWSAASDAAERFRQRLKRSGSVNVNSVSLREEIKLITQTYFAKARPELRGIQQSYLDLLDEAFQELLRLSHGRNARASYNKWLKTIRMLVPQIAADLALGTGRANAPTSTEAQIISTLKAIVPSASLSYQQSLSDLADGSRISFRGPAVELREALREVLDHLAPDDVVINSDGFRLEKDRSKPTMKQKVRFILRARGRSKSASTVPENSVVTIEGMVGDLTRSVYDQGSIATHVVVDKRTVLQLKRYVDAVLQDLLEL